MKKSKIDDLIGRRIVSVRYMSTKEADGMMWAHPPVILKLDDGSIIYPTSDAEGNDGGNLFVQPAKLDGKMEVL